MVTLRALIEEASGVGAERALAALASRTSMRGATWTICGSCCAPGETRKRSATRAVVSWAVRILLALLVAGLAVKAGLLELIRS